MRYISHPGTATMLTVFGLSFGFCTSSAIAWTSGYHQVGFWPGTSGGLLLLFTAFVLGYILSHSQDEHIEAGQRLLDKGSITEEDFQRRYLGTKDYKEFKLRRMKEGVASRADIRAETDAEKAFDKYAALMMVSFTNQVLVTERSVEAVKLLIHLDSSHLNSVDPLILTNVRIQAIRDGQNVDIPVTPDQLAIGTKELVQELEVDLAQYAGWGEFQARLLVDTSSHVFGSPPFTVPSVLSTEDSPTG